MRLLRAVSEDDMVAAFLTAEVASVRYGPRIREILARLGWPLAVVTQPDLSDESANAVRRQILASYRLYPSGDVFTGMPADVRWYRAALTPAIIVIGEPGPANLVVVEGHKRLTGLLVCPAWLPAELEVVLGLTARHRK